MNGKPVTSAHAKSSMLDTYCLTDVGHLSAVLRIGDV